MSQEKQITEREAVLRERKAFQIGWQRECSLDEAFSDVNVTLMLRSVDARYPLPKVTRPRVWVDESGMGWKVIDGAFWYTLSVVPSLCEWKRDDPAEVTHELTTTRVLGWAALLANPTEEVDA